MDFHAVALDVERYIRHMNEVILKILFDDIALVSETNDEIVDLVSRVYPHDMPNDRLAADFNHWFWLSVCFFSEARSETAGQYDGFHYFIPNLRRGQSTQGGRGSPIALFAPGGGILFAWPRRRAPF
jgi:hypothetical protein